MSDNKSFFGAMSEQEFLDNYWQKKPLFTKNAFKNWQEQISKESFFELAAEDSLMSRFVGYDGDWVVDSGPFSSEDLQEFGDSNWTILVQDLEKKLPNMEKLQQKFNFIPNWRLDDVMVSYATDQGTVGPHIDNYDVFLIQNHGRRRWKLGGEPLVEENLIPDVDLKLLREYSVEQEVEVGPGDMLYIPPRFMHYGVSEGESSCISVGFHAPNLYDLVLAFAESNQDVLQRNIYLDSGIQSRDDSNYMDDMNVSSTVAELMGRLSSLATKDLSWFASLVTEPKRFWQHEIPEGDLVPGDYRLAAGVYPTILNSNVASKIFFDGEGYALDKEDFEIASEMLKRKVFKITEQTIAQNKSLYSMLNCLFEGKILVPS